MVCYQEIKCYITKKQLATNSNGIEIDARINMEPLIKMRMLDRRIISAEPLIQRHVGKTPMLIWRVGDIG